MNVNRERLGEEVGKIVDALAPSDNELLLLDAVSNPVVPHVYALGKFGFDSVQCNPFRALVITKNDGLSLWVSS